MGNILVIDCETIGVKDLSAFEISFAVVNLDKFKVENINGYLVKEVYNTDLFKKAFYYDRNKEQYKKLLKENKIKLVPIAEIRDELNKILKEKNIKYISAFNIKFDIKVLSFNFIKYLNRKKQLTYQALKDSGFICLDIPTLFLYTKILKDFDYTDYCISNGFITEKGNIKATAETVYSFIKKDKEHIESHIAVNDVIEEAEILLHIFKYYSKNKSFKDDLEKSITDTIKNILIWRKIKKHVKERN